MLCTDCLELGCGRGYVEPRKVESQAAIELIALRADVEVDLLDHSGTSAILSRSRGDPQNPLLAPLVNRAAYAKMSVRYYRMQEEGAQKG